MSDDVPKPSGTQVLVSDRQADPLPSSDVAALAALTERVLAEEGRRDVELSLSFVDPDEMADLHQRYMDEPGPTDVLAFPLEDDDLLGDVIVCPAVATGNNPDRDAELRL